MSIIQAIIIAIVEGITEFLPVSSTAHMKFTNTLIGVVNSPFTNMFEVVIQLVRLTILQVHNPVKTPTILQLRPITIEFRQIISEIPTEAPTNVEVGVPPLQLRGQAVVGLGRIWNEILAIAGVVN